MLHELGVPSELEGLVSIQVFKAGRGYADSASFEVSEDQLDGAHLRIGDLPDEYLRVRALGGAQLDAHLCGITGGGMPLAARVEGVFERDRTEFPFRSRPMAMLLGWRETRVRRREPVDGWDWVDLAAEHERGVELRREVHARLDRLAAALSIGLGDLIEDRVATHHFWVAPGETPVVVIRGVAGSAEAHVRSHAAFPRAEVEEWIERISGLPPTLSDALSESLRLLATAGATERSWLRFTLGWAALERLASEIGSTLDDQIVVEQRRCHSCGADVTERTRRSGPGLKRSLTRWGLRRPLISPLNWRGSTG